jgi:acetyltransferase-like isoleucine patch superfamily enzyme
MNLRQILSYGYLGQQRFKLALCSKVTTVIMNFRLFLVNATVGKGAIFFGKTYLQVHPSGNLTCGDNSVFRSSEQSNSIGVKQRCFLSVGRNARLSIGDNCGFSGSVINAMHSISIGSRVMLGANVTIADSDRHPINAKERAAGDGGVCAPVVIGDDVWVGMNTVILKGSIIGNNVVIGANSLVSGQIPDNCIAVGSPARVVKMLEPLND